MTHNTLLITAPLMLAFALNAGHSGLALAGERAVSLDTPPLTVCPLTPLPPPLPPSESPHFLCA